MRDILLFNTFVTQDVLIVFYYIGAVLMPVVLYVFRKELIGHVAFFKRVNDRLKAFYGNFTTGQKTVFWLVFFTIFLCMELCWRMVFEAMIGYFDMHDFLYQIANKGVLDAKR